MLCLTSEQLHARIYSSFADIAESAISGVVNIRTTAALKKREQAMGPYQFFLGRPPTTAEQESALGSGVIIDPKGYIVTNYHLIAGAEAIEVFFAKSKRGTKATVVGIDQQTDLALLKITPPFALQPLDLGDSDAIRVGDVILAIGNPFGYSHTVTSGIISAKGRVIGTGPFDNFLQTDAPIHPGNSGGPLIDLRGRVIGIATAVHADGGGIGFAIPVNMAKDIIRDLKRTGKVIRPWLGIVCKDILSIEEISDARDPIGLSGVVIQNLVVEGPAEKAGLRIGDLITELASSKIHDTHALRKALASFAPGKSAKIKVYRRNKGFLTLTLKIEELPSATELPTEKQVI
jgi:S1-C subfamily serine protease